MYRSTLPPSYLPKEQAMDKLRGAIFQKHLREIPTFALASLNPKTCPKHLLDTLAQFYAVDFYKNDFLEADKRALIFHSIELKKIKGTIGALRVAFASLGVEIDIKEWFNYAGEPFKFKLDFTSKDKEITAQLLSTLTNMVEEYKNVRSVLEEIKLRYKVQNTIHINIGGAGQMRQETQMIEGYSSTVLSSIYINTGAVGQTRCLAIMEV